MNAASWAQLEESIKTAAQPDHTWDQEEATRAYQAWLVEQPGRASHLASNAELGGVPPHSQTQRHGPAHRGVGSRVG
jgi:hypothetical protein